MRYTYDNKERLFNVKALRSQGAVVSSFTYGYNKIDNRTFMKIDHENVLVNYGYDGLSRLMSESWNMGAGSSCVNQFTSQPQGNESGFSNTVAATPGAGVLTSPYLAAYAYDAAGNRTARYRMDGGSTYVVDDENRLTSESPFTSQALVPATTTTQDNWVELDFGAPVSVFRLDVALPDLNRRFKLQAFVDSAWQDISSLAALGATLDADGYFTPFSQSPKVLCASLSAPRIRYWQESGSSSGVSLIAYTMVAGTPIAYEYYDNGNQKTRTQGSLVETYRHDYANRIDLYVNQQGAYPYIFAPSGERMAKGNPDGSSEWYMYDGGDVVTDYAKPSGGAYTLSATYANGLGIDSKIAKYDPAGAPSYYIPDALGSVHRILDGAQNVTNTYLTNAWGESLIAIEGQSNRYGFTQRERDPESSLMHYRARSYDPRLGRFVQKDPAGQDLNFYMYTANNPVNAVDPSGRIVIFVHGIGESQHREKAKHMAKGMRERWAIEGKVEQHMIHFLYGPAGKWDAWDQDTARNKNAAKALKKLVEGIQVERLQLSNDEKAKGGKGDVEPIYILAYSNGTIVTTFALEQGMTIDGALFIGGALENDHDMTKALKGTPFLHNYWSDEDGTTKTVDGIGNQGFANKYGKITEHSIGEIDHYIEDRYRTSNSSKRVDGYSEWSSKFMGSTYYASRLSTKTGNLSAVYNARGEKVQQNDIYPLRYTEKAAKELGKVSEYHSGVR